MNNGSPQRFKFSFSLRTFFILFTAFACWIGWNAYRVQQRNAAITYITSHGGQVFYKEPEKPWRQIPLGWRILGAKPVQQLYGAGSLHDPGDQEQLRRLFPEATIEP